MKYHVVFGSIGSLQITNEEEIGNTILTWFQINFIMGRRRLNCFIWSIMKKADITWNIAIHVLISGSLDAYGFTVCRLILYIDTCILVVQNSFAFSFFLHLECSDKTRLMISHHKLEYTRWSIWEIGLTMRHSNAYNLAVFLCHARNFKTELNMAFHSLLRSRSPLLRNIFRYQLWMWFCSNQPFSSFTKNDNSWTIRRSFR